MRGKIYIAGREIGGERGRGIDWGKIRGGAETGKKEPDPDRVQ